MKYISGTLSFVVIVDWNYSYMHPTWISQNIFGSEEGVSVELSVNEDNVYSVVTKYKNISIKPLNRTYIIACSSYEIGRASCRETV